MHKSEFGVIGLGVMGKSISLNIAENGFSTSVYNRICEGEENVVDDFIHSTSLKNINGFTNLKSFVEGIERPRRILIMIKAGTAIDTIIQQILPFLHKGDVIIDGGNSLFTDTQRRTIYLNQAEIDFIGCGISGGEEGARKGPSIMPGGSFESYLKVAPILEKIAAKDNSGKPCCTFIGNDGAGHFIKMIHNGIEYAEMQLIAEVYSILKVSFTNDEISKLFHEWNIENTGNYLLEITSKILTKKEGNNYLIDLILDKSGNKGTGSWSSKTALDLGFPGTMITAAVFDRFISSFKKDRVELSKNLTRKVHFNAPKIEDLKKAYQFARIINHHQGFLLMKEASKTYNWNLNFSEIARIWTNGCIIRSKFMEKSIEILKHNSDYLKDNQTFNSLHDNEDAIVETLKYGLENRIPLNTLNASFNYWMSITSERLPANIIQAQRDFFGAHTYQRIDKKEQEYFHTTW